VPSSVATHETNEVKVASMPDTFFMRKRQKLLIRGIQRWLEESSRF